MSVAADLQPRHFKPEERFRLLSRKIAEKLVTVPYDADDVKGDLWMLRNNDDGSVELIAAFTKVREAWSVLQQLVLDAVERERSRGWGS